MSRQTSSYCVIFRYYFLLVFCCFGANAGYFSLTGLTSVIPSWETIFPKYGEFVKLYEQYAEYVLTSKNAVENTLYEEPECSMTTTDIIQHFGYPAEIHHVITDDGYILELHRIPSNGTTSTRSPVLLQHGLLASSSDWIINMPNQSLGYMLADSGYDVWLGNIRGNTYSTNHTSLDLNSREFWEFSYDEMGKFDLPAMIDYILVATNNKQLTLVAHSMGTTMSFVMLSSLVEYNDKIKSFFALGPVAAIGHMKCEPVKQLSNFDREISVALRAVGVYHILSNSNFLKYFAQTTCAVAPLNEFCADIVFEIAGRNPSELNMTRLPVYFTHTPAGASVQTLHHFSQNYQKNKLQHYDYGLFKNFAKYGQFTPPSYDLAKVTVPTVIFYALNDLLAVPEDVDATAAKLTNLVGKFQAGGENFTHLDLIWGIDANVFVNQKILNLMTL